MIILGQKHLILLSDEGDYLKVLGKNRFRSTQNKLLATKFKDRYKANKAMRELGVAFMWNTARPILYK